MTSPASEPDLDQVPVPALLRAARGAYGHAIRDALAERGMDDLPRNSAFIIGGMGNHGQPASALVRQLGVTKQAASQLIDTLVVRGYLTRAADPEDRRRMNLSLTDRGREAADAVRSGVADVDRELTERIGVAGVHQLRAGLEGLCDIRDRMEMEMATR